MHTHLGALRFDNSFVARLPADPEPRNHRRQVLGACYSRVQPTPVGAPRLLALSPEVARLLELDPHTVDQDALAAALAGNAVLPSMAPYAACYGGHQFGHWAGQLGDGRAITLGETVNAAGERWELQLKGAGPTPYSRSADGRAVLRSSIREFLCSEAMHHLGVPTTRALSLVSTGESVVRDMMYDGNPRPEPGAVVCRVAPSFLRFGNFEILAARRDVEVLRQLADYALEMHFPTLGAGREGYQRMLAEVSRRTALMVLEWMRVGFVHGVMNTDNMSLLGLTIDYGPYGWIDDYDPDWTPNTTDAGHRRYRFGHQPQVALWNLARLAEALHPLIGAVEPLHEALEVYARTMEAGQRAMMAAKLGLEPRPDGDEALVQELLGLLGDAETDMTLFYRGLADVPSAADVEDAALVGPIAPAWYAEEVAPGHRRRVIGWLRRYGARVREDGTPDPVRREAMNAVNPKYVLRNYLAQVAIDAAEAGDASEVLRLLDVMRRPYAEQPERAAYAARRPDWARDRPGCSMLSCSS